MFVEIDGTPWAVLSTGSGTVRVYDLTDSEFRAFDAPAALDEGVARKLVEQAIAQERDEHTVVVDGVTYQIHDSDTYTQITKDGEFFTEADWEGPMDKDSAEELIREELSLD